MDDGWSSEWPDGPFDHENVPTVCCRFEGNFIDSPNVSKDDSIESYMGEHSEKSDTNITKPTFKSILQAKKRLQAFSVTKQLKKNSKDEKTEDLEKSDKMLPKKSRKVGEYPMDKAQAVVQEIEEIKQKEAEEAEQEQKKIDAIMAVAYKNLSLKEVFRVRSRSPSSEREEQFKRREIKSRNYRRFDSFKRKSASPEVSSQRIGKLVYPRNWTEYKEQGLTIIKDEELKSKMFPKMKLDPHELVAKVLNFDGPSPLLESVKSLTVDEKLENIPVYFLRITKSKPTVTYSVNSKKTRASYISRKQLFNVIPKERKSAIEKLINSASSRPQFQSRTWTSRPWYTKSWKRLADAECKIIENSVGLSFLQTYSDEEEENEGEEIIPKPITPTKKREEKVNKQDHLEKSKRKTKSRVTLTPEPEAFERKLTAEALPEVKNHQKEEQRKKHQKKESSEEVDNRCREKSEKLEKQKGEGEILDGTRKNQIENFSDDVKKKDKDELNETRKAIKELEEELERRKAIRMEGEKATKKKKKKKKSKTKEMSSESEDEDRPAKKKKKTTILKKKRNSVEGDESSSDSSKQKKYKKKTKRKKNNVVKGKVRAKMTSSPAKEDTPKMSGEEHEDDCNDHSRKKGKLVTETDCEPMGVEEIWRAKTKVRDKCKETADEEVVTEESATMKSKKLPIQDEKYEVKIKGNHLDSHAYFETKKGHLSPSTIDKSDGKASRNSRERLDGHGGDDSTWSTKRQRDSRSYRRESVTSIKSKEGIKNQRDFEIHSNRRSNEKLKDKSRCEEEQLNSKTDTDRDRKCSDRSVKNRNEERDERERSHSSEKEDLKVKRQCVKSESQMENRCKPKPVLVKCEPNWEDLRSKRNRYRHNNYKELADKFSNEFGDFPLERDLYFPKETKKDCKKSRDGLKCEIGTPDTEEYRENWEKDSYPIWESDDETPPKARDKLNSSWESDEEIFERAQEITNKSRPLSDTLDLEIPLNIKPFKRREIIDPDAELRLLKKQSLSLSEERRRLEIQKMRVKELELEVVKEVQSKAKVEEMPKRRRSRTEDDTEGVAAKKIPFIDVSVENEAATRKRGRWDKKSSSPKSFDRYSEASYFGNVKKEIADDEDSSTNVSSSTSVNTSAVLENEYEEFMKALTSSPKKPHTKKTAKNEAHSDVVCCLTPPHEHDKTCNFTNNQLLLKTPAGTNDAKVTVAILPKDIPLIPIPLPKETKPVPVPSPQIEINSIPKPLINLSLSANITLDIAPKFTTPSSPATNVLHSSVKPSPIVQISEREGNGSFASPLTDSSDSFREEGKKLASERPFVFTGMVLPTKRQLLNKSGLNLGDSDDDEKCGKPLQKLEDTLAEDDNDGDKTKDENVQLVSGATPAEKEKRDLQAPKAEPIVEKAKNVDREVKKLERKETPLSRMPQGKESRKRRSPERHKRKGESPRRFSRSKRDSTPPRRRSRESPRRRGHSPKKRSPRRRSPLKRRSPPGKRRRSSRSATPKGRRRSSVSPPRRKTSPRRSLSPRLEPCSPKKPKSKSPDKHLLDKSITKPNRPKSPVTINSPLEGLKRSVADSTISDDLLPQPCVVHEEYAHSPVTHFYDRTLKTLDSPKRESLDARIDHALRIGLDKEEPRPIPTTYSSYSYGQFSQFAKAPEPKSNLVVVQQTFNATLTQQSKSNFVQVGNMVQILPTEDIPMVSSAPPRQLLPKCEKSQIVQVGNMLQIVPTDLPLEPPPPPPEPEKDEQPVNAPTSPIIVFHEKQSAESSMRLKVAERREEREKRRQERERRRKEKEKRRKEKEKQRQMRLKQRTENMIKRALELEAEEDRETVVNETPAQWPPLPSPACVLPSKEAGKSILVRANSREESPRMEKRKTVQFADGVRPGEGTSPSGGEELSSPPPRNKLPKEKRYKKTKLQKKSQKKKVKVKVIKKRPDAEDSDEEDDLPPPSPPPGSPPPHIFPPRLKPQLPSAINTIQPYLPGVVPIQTNHSHQQLFRTPQLNLVMHPHHHGPPPPPHHHGPPPPHHHGPPPPPHHHPHHQGPPLPPGPPHFHHGPPPPPLHHHGPPPPGAHHHHHGPPPPFHR